MFITLWTVMNYEYLVSLTWVDDSNFSGFRDTVILLKQILPPLYPFRVRLPKNPFLFYADVIKEILFPNFTPIFIPKYSNLGWALINVSVKGFTFYVHIYIDHNINEICFYTMQYKNLTLKFKIEFSFAVTFLIDLQLFESIGKV
jgi:hypothetical protein